MKAFMEHVWAVPIIVVSVFCILYLGNQVFSADLTLKDATSGWIGNFFATAISTFISVFLSVWAVQSALENEKRKQKIADRQMQIMNAKSLATGQKSVFSVPHNRK